ncbi:diguanylate cyclase [Marinobacter sp.]|uniref:sensor domain-containing diguanylate cyclase n=1 Tax=Marinobacter sp. TaxID=50741 RepID=UPI003566FF5E
MEHLPPEDGGFNRLRKHHGPLRRSLWVVLVYLVAGLAWISFSDQAVEAWFPDTRTLSEIQTWKGFLFVVVTGFTLFIVVFRQLSKDRMLLSLQARQRRELRHRERQLTVLMDNLPGMAFRCRDDGVGTLLFASAGCEQLTGYSPEELVDRGVVSFIDLIVEAKRGEVAREISGTAQTGAHFSVEYPITRKDGRKVWVWARGCGLKEDDGSTVLEGIVLDISDRKKLEQELEKMATRDSLTGLLNRRELNRVLEEELVRAQRYQRPLAILWIDFDHFKNINDNWGHAAGDLVLCSVSRILESSVRSVDSVGRFGGEEFVVVLPEMGEKEALETAERLRKKVRHKPVQLESGHKVPVTVSIGVSVYPIHGTSLGTLSAAADKAMYQAKKQGRDCVAIAPPAMRVHNETT